MPEPAYLQLNKVEGQEIIIPESEDKQ